METLTMNQMEQIEGGWSWLGCAKGLTAAYMTNSLETAAILGGPAGLAGGAAVACVAGGVLLDE